MLQHREVDRWLRWRKRGMTDKRGKKGVKERDKKVRKGVKGGVDRWEEEKVRDRYIWGEESNCQANFTQTFGMPQKMWIRCFHQPVWSGSIVFLNVSHWMRHINQKNGMESFSDCLVGYWASCCCPLVWANAGNNSCFHLKMKIKKCALQDSTLPTNGHKTSVRASHVGGKRGLTFLGKCDGQI